MAYVKNWLHCVWGTKNKEYLLSVEGKYEIINHIKTNASAKGIYIDYLNGYRDHMHCLLTLNPDLCLAKVMQLIKGESSYWVNKNNLLQKKFEWADEYFGISVSESHLPNIRAYIKNQELHHQKLHWTDEYEELILKYGFSKDQG